MARISLNVPKGYRGRNYQRKCYARDLCLDEREKYSDLLLPVCPELKKWVNEEKLPDIANIPKTNSAMLNSIRRILFVFAGLIQLEPTEGMVVWCAHRHNVLEERLSLIQRDLLSLPKWLESSYSETSKRCDQLLGQLVIARTKYELFHNSYLYLMPPASAREHYLLVLDWRRRQLSRLTTIDPEIWDMNRLTNPFPAEAIKVMSAICQELEPIAHILSEESADTGREDLGDDERSGIHEREVSEEWWSGYFSAPFDIDQLAFPTNRDGKVQSFYYPTHPFKDNQGSARGFKASIKWPNVSRRFPLPMADIRIIEEAVGSEQCDDIKAFLIQQCHLMVAEANELSWDEIVTHLRQWLSRNPDRSGAKSDGTVTVQEPAETELDAGITTKSANIKKEADTRGEAKKLTPHKIQIMRRIIDKLQDRGKKIPFGEKLYPRDYAYWGQQIRDILAETQEIVIWLGQLQYPQETIKVLRDKRYNVNLNHPQLRGPLQLVQIPYELRDAMNVLSDELVAIADEITSTKGTKNETEQDGMSDGGKRKVRPDGKTKKKKRTKAKRQENKFKPWPNKGDACFVIDGQRIFFHYNGTKKDLCLSNGSHTSNLLVLLNVGTLQEADIKEQLCTAGTKPSKIVARANEWLNKKIVEKGFILPLNSIRFIEYIKRFRHYKLRLDMLTEEQFVEKQLEQPLVDDRGLKVLDEAEESFG